jgi:chromate reductase, NAD(P)H dehydrogenase (quinone)
LSGDAQAVGGPTPDPRRTIWVIDSVMPRQDGASQLTEMAKLAAVARPLMLICIMVCVVIFCGFLLADTLGEPAIDRPNLLATRSSAERPHGTPAMSALPKLVGISGSLRRASFCTAILRTAVEQVAEKARLEVITLENIPLYNEDLDTGEPPASVSALQTAIENAAGILIVTPEYNYGMSGVLKNALDWASRPYGRSKLASKFVLSISASPAFTGGVRALSQLTDTLLATDARLVPGPQIVIGLVHEKIRDNRLVDTKSLRYMGNGLNDLLRMIATEGVSLPSCGNGTLHSR